MNPHRWLSASINGRPRPLVACVLVRHTHGGSSDPPSATNTRTAVAELATLTVNEPPAPDLVCRIAFVASSLVSSATSS